MPRKHRATQPPLCNEWIVEFDDAKAVSELRLGLLVNDPSRQSSGRDSTLEFLVDRFAGLRVLIFAREHPPPHFCVKCDRESANYRIADCVQLNGGLQREYSIIRAWHGANKQKLIEAWNRLRPTDCPVGAYREA